MSIAEGEAALIAQGFGRNTLAAFRIGAKYPRYAARLLRTGIQRDSVNLNSQELGQVIENSVVPAFEESAAAPAAAEALEAVGAIAAPEIAAAVALGGIALYAYHKMAGKGGKKKGKVDLSKVTIGIDRPTAQKAAREARKANMPAQYKPQKISQPVSTGEVVRGAAIVERSIRGGVKVMGREVLGVTRAAATPAAFTLVGAFVATPLAYPGSRMGIMAKTYAKYNVRKWNVRVITSSPTTADGQILTYFHHNRHDPVVNWTSTGFITTVLSARNAVVGPKWSDSFLAVKPTPRVLECSFPLGDGHFDLGAGDVFIFTRASTSHSFIVMAEYDIDFTEPQITSRVNLVPFARAQWFYTARNNIYNWTKDTTIADLFAPGGSGKGVDGTASGDNAPGAQVGDIYRFVVDVDNSQFVTTTGTTLTPNNVWDHQVPDNGAFSLSNGTTLYCVFMGSGQYRWFPTLATARTFNNPFRAGLTGTGNLTIVGWSCLVDSLEGTMLQSSV